jgi:hypothetical protein
LDARGARDILSEELLEEHLVVRTRETVPGAAGAECFEADAVRGGDDGADRGEQRDRNHGLYEC